MASLPRITIARCGWRMSCRSTVPIWVMKLARRDGEAGDAREERHHRARHGRVSAETEGVKGFVHGSSVHEMP